MSNFVEGIKDSVTKQSSFMPYTKFDILLMVVLDMRLYIMALTEQSSFMPYTKLDILMMDITLFRVQLLLS